MNSNKVKGIYLVPDPVMMKPNLGPSEHIFVGLKELKKYYNIELLVIDEIKDFHINKVSNKSAQIWGRNNGLVGLLRDLKLVLKSNYKAFVLKRQIQKIGNVEFIYERGQYLDFRGIYCAKKLGIKHFYEVNWINYLGIRQFYYSWLNPIVKLWEEKSYKTSDLSFIVGTQANYLDVSSEKFHIIQNGIYQNKISANIEHVNQIEDRLKLFFVSNLMPWHNFEILVQALNAFKKIDLVELHLIGHNFEKYKDSFPVGLKCFFHGSMNQLELQKFLKKANVGIISGGPPYSSAMKFFDYASHKLIIVCPRLDNFSRVFTDDEVVFFRPNNYLSLLMSLEMIVEDFEKFKKSGERVYLKVAQNYTWEKIYSDINNKINEILVDEIS